MDQVSCPVISVTKHGVDIELLFFNHYNKVCIYIAAVFFNNKISNHTQYIMYTLGHNIRGAYNIFISISAVIKNHRSKS